jgi:hypothetical protein
MSRHIIPLSFRSDHPLPREGWIMEIILKDRLTFAYGNARRVSVDDDFAGAMKEGAGCIPAKFHDGKDYRKGDRPPSALSIVSDEDVVIGLVLGESVGAIFDPAGPVSGGDDGSDKLFTDVTFVSPTAAYFAARVRQCGDHFVARFNIHLLVEGQFVDGTRTVTPIIIDPDIRNPPPGHNAP